MSGVSTLSKPSAPATPPPPRRGMIISALAFAAIFVIGGAGVLVSIKLAQHVSVDQKTTPYANVKQFEADVNSGDLIINADPNATAVTVAERRSWSPRTIDEPSLSKRLAGGTLTVTAGGCHGGIGINTCKTSLTVTVPATLPVSVHTDSGYTRVVGTTAAITVRSDSGAVTLEGVTGDINAQVGSGDLTGTHLGSQRFAATVDSGSVKIGFANPPTDVRTAVDSGDTEILVPRNSGGYDARATTDSGVPDVSVDRSSSTRHINATSDSGNVTIGYGS